MSKLNDLKFWIYEKKKARTSDVIRWGVENYSNRSERDMRLLAEQKWVRRMRDDEKDLFMQDSKEEWWVWDKKEINGAI